MIDGVVDKQVKQKSSGLSFEQFASLVELVDEHAEAAQQNTGDEDDLEGLETMFTQLSKDGNTLPVEDFMAWDMIQDLFLEGHFTPNSLTDLLAYMGIASDGVMTADQFSAVVERIQLAIEAAGEQAESPNIATIDRKDYQSDYLKLRGKVRFFHG